MNAYKIKLAKEMKPNEFIVIANSMCRAEKVYRMSSRYDTIQNIELLQDNIIIDKEEFLAEFGRANGNYSKKRPTNNN